VAPGTELRPRRSDPAVHRGARRAHPRFAIHASVELLDPPGVTGIVLNLSSGGVRVAVTRALPVGARCHARLVTETGAELLLYLRVVWSRCRVDGCLLGMEIVRTPEAETPEPRVRVSRILPVGVHGGL